MRVDENSPLTIGEETATTDKEKVAFITKHFNIANDVCITDMFRLGKADVSGTIRPLKISFQKGEIADKFLSSLKKLQEIRNISMKLFIRPDKTKSAKNSIV